MSMYTPFVTETTSRDEAALERGRHALIRGWSTTVTREVPNPVWNALDKLMAAM